MDFLSTVSIDFEQNLLQCAVCPTHSEVSAGTSPENVGIVSRCLWGMRHASGWAGDTSAIQCRSIVCVSRCLWVIRHTSGWAGDTSATQCRSIVCMCVRVLYILIMYVRASLLNNTSSRAINTRSRNAAIFGYWST